MSNFQRGHVLADPTSQKTSKQRLSQRHNVRVQTRQAAKSSQSDLPDGNANLGTESTTHQPPSTPAPAILEIKALRKNYGKIEALRGVDLTLYEGQRLALLGPNGAGKTTLIRSLIGRTKPSAGTIRLFGRPINSREGRNALGVVPQEIALYRDLTTRENLRAFGRLGGLSRRELRDRIDWALQWTGLEQRTDDLVGGFSGGMQRRVNIACGVMHSPKILLLDEPTVGVDPQSRQRIFMMLDQLSEMGTSILLTTHHLDEAQQRSDRIVIIDQGRVIADGTLASLVNETVGPSRLVRVRLSSAFRGNQLPPNSFSAELSGENQIQARIKNVSQQLPLLMNWIRQLGADVADLEVHAPSLHHVFLHLTGHELRD